MKGEISKCINIFKDAAIKQFAYTKEGNWKKGNAQVKRMNIAFEKLKESGVEGRNALLELIYDDKECVSISAAVYSMSYNPDKCISVLEKLAEQDIPHISYDAKLSLQNWNNGEWYIE